MISSHWIQTCNLDILIFCVKSLFEHSQTGDFHQLGPVVHSALAQNHGYAISPIERLMNNFQLYKKVNRASFNSMVITKLCDNYRAHPKLLEAPSKLFYERELRACADPEIVCKLENLEWLPKKGFPMIFHNVR